VTGGIEIRGPRLLLRALRDTEIDGEWQALVDADPMTVAGPRDESAFDIGIGLRAHARGQGHGREALTLLTGWLFGHAGAQVVEGATDPANAPMRAVFLRAGWDFAGPVTEFGREWAVYRITRDASGLLPR
jgi:RimJ/RimL family protein N-acetyltransferase